MKPFRLRLREYLDDKKIMLGFSTTGELTEWCREEGLIYNENTPQKKMKADLLNVYQRDYEQAEITRLKQEEIVNGRNNG